MRKMMAAPFLILSISLSLSAYAKEAAGVKKLNELIQKELAPDADRFYQEELEKTYQAYNLQITPEALASFKNKFFKPGSRPAIEVVSERVDGSGKAFSLLAASTASIGRLKNNLSETLKFIAYFHAKNFGSQNGFLFNFNRVEITASELLSEEGLLSLNQKVLRVNLPVLREVTSADLFEKWNSGDVLLSYPESKMPRITLKVLARFGNLKDKAGMVVLNNWDLFNPISDLRVTLAGAYHAHAKSLLEQISRMDELTLIDQVQQVSPALANPVNLKYKLVQALQNPEMGGKALESLFQIEEKNSNSQSGSGDINVINRNSWICGVKVTNSHVIKVDWSESAFSDSKKNPSEPVSIEIKGDAISIKAMSHQDVHVVNDKNKLSLVCVDTNDNIQVNVDQLLSQISEMINEKAVLKAALKKVY